MGSSVKPYELDSVKRMLGALNFKKPEDINQQGLLNLKNGVLNLDTGQLCEHSPSILSTVQSGVSFDLAPSGLDGRSFSTKSCLMKVSS